MSTTTITEATGRHYTLIIADLQGHGHALIVSVQDKDRTEEHTVHTGLFASVAGAEESGWDFIRAQAHFEILVEGVVDGAEACEHVCTVKGYNRCRTMLESLESLSYNPKYEPHGGSYLSPGMEEIDRLSGVVPRARIPRSEVQAQQIKEIRRIRRRAQRELESGEEGIEPRIGKVAILETMKVAILETMMSELASSLDEERVRAGLEKNLSVDQAMAGSATK